MAAARLTQATVAQFSARAAAITPESQRRWGKLEPAAVLRHLRGAVELSLGEVEWPDESTFFSRNVLKHIIFQPWMPWPKGKIKVPAEWTPKPDGDCIAERQKLNLALGRFVMKAGGEPSRRAVHPLFGPLTLNEWARAHGRHFEHHFQQFGV